MSFLGRRPRERWPAGDLLQQLELRPASGWMTLQQLLRIGVIEAGPSDDGVVRLQLTALGRRRLSNSRV